MSTTKSDEELLRELENEAAAPPASESEADEAALLNEGVSPNIELENILPAGEYLGKFVEVTVMRSKPKRDPKTQLETTGTLYLYCKLEILRGDHAGRFIWDRIMLEGKGAPRMARVASVLGRYDRDAKCLTGFKSATPTAGEIKQWLLGQVVLAETEIEPAKEYQGKKQPPRSVVTFAGYNEVPKESLPAEVTAPAWG